jgi:hypothetical protein
MVGAFLAGVVMDGERFGQEALDALFKNVLLVLMPVFYRNHLCQHPAGQANHHQRDLYRSVADGSRQ